jgi:hypothetical protein
MSTDAGLVSVNREDASTGEKGLNNKFVASSRTRQKNETASMHCLSAMRSISSKMSTSHPMDFKFITNTSTERGNSTSSGSQKIRANDVYDQQMVLSARDKIFAPKATVCKYRPRNLGGNGKSVAHGTKPGPQWCPTGLTHAQKRRIQRLRALLIREEIAEKKCDEWFNRDRSMVPPKVTQKAKRIIRGK